MYKLPAMVPILFFQICFILKKIKIYSHIQHDYPHISPSPCRRMLESGLSSRRLRPTVLPGPSRCNCGSLTPTGNIGHA